MRLAIMQPYFLPYIGYFQLIAASDLFVVYDNIKYTKKGWINRNRMLQNGQAAIFSLPLSKGSDQLDVAGRELAGEFRPQQLLQRFRGAYIRAPHFAETCALLERILSCEERNLFRFIEQSIVLTCAHLGIDTPIRVSSSISIDHDLRSQDKVLAICEALGANSYVNPIGGVDLYQHEVFAKRGIELDFMRSTMPEYQQFGQPFEPWLSIIDVLMFNPLPKVRAHIAGDLSLL